MQKYRFPKMRYYAGFSQIGSQIPYLARLNTFYLARLNTLSCRIKFHILQDCIPYLAYIVLPPGMVAAVEASTNSMNMREEGEVKSRDVIPTSNM